MPEQALAKTFCGLLASTITENTSESSIMPLLMCSQFAPPSGVFHARCQVPAYTTFGSFGSTAIDSMFLISPLLGDKRSQLSPPSLLRNTPSRAPVTITLGSEAASAMARIDFPCIPESCSHVLPPSRLRKISPTCWLCTLHAETYMMFESLGLMAM